MLYEALFIYQHLQKLREYVHWVQIHAFYAKCLSISGNMNMSGFLTV
jgi:hypothetical protein